MFLTIKSLYKTLKIFIFAAACFGQVSAVAFKGKKIFFIEPETISSNACENFLFHDQKLFCYNGITEKKQVKTIAINQYNQLIGAITINSQGARKLEMCDKTFRSLNAINLGDFLPYKIYYTPNGKYLIALTFHKDDTFWRDAPCIKIINPSKPIDPIVASYTIKMPQNLKVSISRDDYLVVPDNQHIVYISSHESNKNQCSRYFKILKLISEEPYIKEMDNLQENGEAVYITLANELVANPGTIPLYINPEKYYFLLYFEKDEIIKKFTLSSDNDAAPKINLALFDYSYKPIAIFPDKYLAFHDSGHLRLFNLNLKLLDEHIIGKEDGPVYSLRFSGSGKHLAVTTKTSVIVLTITSDTQEELKN